MQSEPTESTYKTWGVFVVKGSESFIQQVIDALNYLQTSTVTGRDLIAALTDNRTTHLPFIGESFLHPTPLHLYRGKQACGMTQTGTVTYNASGCFPNNRCPSRGDPNWNQVPGYVGLLHELVHTYLHFVMSAGQHADRECMATGLGPYFASMPYSENRLRCELGLPVRPCYDDHCDQFSAPQCQAANPAVPGSQPVPAP